ncbi:MAG TPA: hypothetical protein VM688_04740 [Nocardioidaceae bacterium]|jgi:hypothetical protein|nr:hypothetical protein [Nocardioidaceae bacterium]
MTTYANTPAYTPHKPKPRVSSEELRARIPGWGADLDPADRPSVPREQFDENLSGARWEYPDVQPETWPRERSIEHAGLTPVFGTAQPPRGVSGAIRKLAYARYSEGRAAHWLLLILADRVNTLGSTLGSFASLHPDNLITETGILSEFKVNGWKSRVGQGRTDIKHHPLDPLIVAGPWVLGGWFGYRVLRRLRRTA